MHMEGRLNSTTAGYLANISAFAHGRQILTCKQLGCLPVLLSSHLSHLSPFFSNILLSHF